MAKLIDITDKLSFEGNPRLVIRGSELEVNADAPTMLKVMSLMAGKETGADEILNAFDLMFTKNAKKEIENLHLSFKDLIVLVQEAIKLIAGEEDNPGEQ